MSLAQRRTRLMHLIRIPRPRYANKVVIEEIMLVNRLDRIQPGVVLSSVYVYVCMCASLPAVSLASPLGRARSIRCAVQSDRYL